MGGIAGSGSRLPDKSGCRIWQFARTGESSILKMKIVTFHRDFFAFFH